MGSIYLIRHGQASFGADDYDVLSPTGVRQAEILGEHLASLGLRLDRCLSGDLRRQRHTAQAALGRMQAAGLEVPPLEVDPAFNEFEAEAVIRAHLPDLLHEEPHALHIMRNASEHRAEFQRLFSMVISRWVSGEHHKDGLVSWQEFLDTAHAGLQRLLQQASGREHIAVFTSGGTITALVQQLVGMPPIKAFELNWQIVNTSLSRLKFRGDEVSLASFNSHVHLELLRAPELITYR
ncbi:histidine phosphatase family protein [Pseudomonas panipatensis]|uniref:Broad specificity phosphatase PhoE n=1 Tax=Pseudomonas panipatensis TaxID=428992 RepID=A0A1G8FDI6_9PSED|nr:histidine phosphatase family protein [Pseudomonas panipatensis]SDH80049.1 Broad specificity phosphatase PhoE [Pseudomonas panipatensis]SMP54448.1 Broad specificity phosphatase PhoE [Pseudomonas panipatensis]